MTTRTQARLLLLLRAWSIFPKSAAEKSLNTNGNALLSGERSTRSELSLSLSLSLSVCVCVCVCIYIYVRVYICICVCVCECSLSFSLTRSFQKCNEQNFSRYFQVCHTQKMFYFYFDAVYTYVYICVYYYNFTTEAIVANRFTCVCNCSYNS